jgi:hypothetical protein
MRYESQIVGRPPRESRIDVLRMHGAKGVSPEAVLSADADPGERMQETKNIHEPQNYSDHHDGI